MKKQTDRDLAVCPAVARDEENMPEPPDFTAIDSNKVKAAVDQLYEKLSGKDHIDKKIKAKLKICN